MTQYIFNNFKQTKANPIDANTHISSISNIDSELPTKIRTLGYLYYVLDEKQFYVFVDGTNNSDFIKLSSLVNTDQVRVVNLSVNINEGETIITHSLGKSEYSIVSFTDTNGNICHFNYKKFNGDESNKCIIYSNFALSNVVLKFLV